MAESNKSDLEFRADVRREARRAGEPINDDTVVTVIRDESGHPKVESIKPVWRPPEKLSDPVKPHWVWIWIAVVFVLVIAWLVLFMYFSNHQAPYSAPVH